MTEQAADPPPDPAAGPVAPRERPPGEGAERRRLRLMAAALVALWALTAIAVATTYRPGGPLDIVVALACFLPVLVADAGLVWPATGVDQRHRLLLAWVWIAAVLFGIPVLYGVGSALVDDSPRSLVPSYEEAYATVLALLPMAFFSLVGVVHQRLGVRPLERRASLVTAVAAGTLTLLAGLAFIVVTVVNDQSLRDDGAVASRFGPTDPDLVPPFCDAPLALGDDARILIQATSSVDGETRGRAVLRGRRGGGDERWSGTWRGPDGEGQLSYLRVGPQAWLNVGRDDPAAPGTTWQETTPDPFGLQGSEPLTMDGPPHDVAHAPRGELVAEDLGLVLIEGARARHCRTYLDGDTALDTFLPLRWLLSNDSFTRAAIPRWRGTLDWWVFGDGELGSAAVEISGSRAETEWQVEGVRAALEARLEATERDVRVDVSAPVVASAAPSPVSEETAPGG